METPTLWNGQMDFPHSKGISHTLELRRSFAIVEAFHGPPSMEDCPARARLPNKASESTDGETETNWR